MLPRVLRGRPSSLALSALSARASFASSASLARPARGLATAPAAVAASASNGWWNHRAAIFSFAVAYGGICLGTALSNSHELPATESAPIAEAAPREAAGAPAAEEESAPVPDDSLTYVKTSEESTLKIFSGNANPALAAEVAAHLGMQLGRANVARFTDGEVNLRVVDNVRGKHVFIVQSLAPPVNESLIELILLISCLRRASAASITAVVPYYAYARHARGSKGEDVPLVDGDARPVASSDVAKMLSVAGVDRVVVVDVHHTQITGLFGTTPVDDLDATGIAAKFFSRYKSVRAPVIVAPDHDGVARAKRLRDSLIKRYGMEDAALAVVVDQRQTGVELETAASADAFYDANFELVGDVAGRDCIIRDDICESGWRVAHAAEVLKRSGARRVYAFVTHSLMSREGLERLESTAALDELICTNTVKLSHESDKVQQLSVAALIAETVKRIHANESVSALFK